MFKIIHTSDWHLGQYFYTRHRKHEHQQFLQWLLELVEKESVDAIIVAGDIFDTSAPPSYARELYNEFIIGIQKLECQLVFVAGNHDSVAVLNESKRLLKQLHTHVIAQVSEQPEEQLIMLQNQQQGMLVCAVPFVRPRDVVLSEAQQSGLQKRQQMGEAIKAHYQSLYTRACELRDEATTAMPILMTGHLSALGVSQSDSVRDIYIGSLDGFPASDFPPADYIALGHIHKAQKVAGKEHIRYCGSPIPLSFDELSQPKSVELVCFEQQALQSVTSITIPRFQAMQKLKGNLKELEQQLAQLPRDESIWLSVEVTEQDFLSDLQQRLQLMTEGSRLEILQVTRAKGQRRQVLSAQHIESLSELTPMEVFERRLALEDFSGEEQQVRIARLKTLFNEIESSLDEGVETPAKAAKLAAEQGKLL